MATTLALLCSFISLATAQQFGEQWNRTGITAFFAISIPLGLLWLCCGLGTYLFVRQTHDQAEDEYKWEELGKTNEVVSYTDITCKKHTRLSVAVRHLPKLELIAIFYDTCALSGLAFADSIQWPTSTKPLFFLSRVFLFDVSPVAYPFVVWVFFAFVLGMLLSSSPLLRLCSSSWAEKMKAKVLLPLWKFIFLVPSIGVYTQLLAPFSCTYTVSPPVMDFDHRTVCWQGVQLGYVVVAGLLLLPYYVLSLIATAGANTLGGDKFGEESYPIGGPTPAMNMDITLTKPHMLIIVFHVKIIVAAICLFFKPYKWYLLGTLGCSLVIMWFVNHKAAPSMVAQLNILRGLGYAFALCPVVGGFVAAFQEKQESHVPLVVVLGGCCAVVVIGIVLLNYTRHQTVPVVQRNRQYEDTCPSDEESPEAGL
eukprot:TRINITY_DN6199_c0_g1_i1.p1 TRINITY_DN6199_c0_g1~~TRINITY_DN6199_c0_g1_i1.p1  ORF type:complete len:424 (-),score=52.50 TRINITY_DN6199_c0_g1_i1:8-1279(-)